MSNICFLVNPKSGGRLGKKIIDQLSRATSSLSSIANHKISVFGLENHALQSIVAQARTNDFIVIAGGDGTVCSLLPYLLGYEGKLAIFPLGTGNDLACELNLKRVRSDTDIVELTLRMISMSTRTITVWRIDSLTPSLASRYFINYVSFGFEGKVIYKVNEWRSGKAHALLGSVLGMRIAYAIASFLGLLSTGQIDVEFVNSSPGTACGIRTALKSLLFVNIRSIMGLAKSNRLSDPSDQQLEVLQIKSPLSFLGMLCSDSTPVCLRPKVEAATDFEFRIATYSSADSLFGQLDGEPILIKNNSQHRISAAGSLSFICNN